MIQRISEPVSVVTAFDASARATRPISLQWSHHTYPVTQVGLRHTYREGITRHHVFSVIARMGNTESLAKLDRAKWDSYNNCLFFRLNLNADSLHWTLEEVSDGLPD